MESILDLRSPPLTALFSAFTQLGDAGFFMVFVPLGYWLWRPGLFTRFSLVLLGSTMLNVTLKEIFQVPRPEAAQLIHAAGWSFPSGHAQNAAAIWPWLALELSSRLGPRQAASRRWLWPVVALMVVGVATSRVYLGVHTPRDVIAGVTLGGMLGLAAWRCGRQVPAWWEDLGPHLQAAVVAAGVAAWATIILRVSIDPAAPTAGGALAGFWIGSIYQRHRLGFVPSVEGWRPLAVIALGLGGIAAMRYGLDRLSLPSFGGITLSALRSAPGVADLLRYFAIAAWISFLGPWLFLKLGLLRRHDPSS